MSVVSAINTSAIFLGESIRFIAQGVTDLNGNSLTSPTQIQIDLVRALDGSHASGFPTTTGWVSDGGGQFHYDYLLTTTDIIGSWSVLWKITNGTYVNESALNFSVNLFNGQLQITTQPPPPPIVFAYVLQNVTTDPVNPSVGQLWLNTTTNQAKYNSANGVIVLTRPTFAWNQLGFKTDALLTPNGPIDGGDFGPSSLASGTAGQAGPPFSSTLGFQEMINELATIDGGTGGVIPNGSTYDLTGNQLIVPNNVPLEIRGLSPITQSANVPSPVVGPIIAYGGNDWLLKTNGTAPTTSNYYFNLRDLTFSLYGGNYNGGLNALNLPMQLKGTVEVVDYTASGSLRVNGSTGIYWDYNTGSGSNGYELLNDNVFVKGFDTCMQVNVDHFQLAKAHFLFGHSAQLQMGNGTYYPLNPTFGDLHFVAGSSNTVTNMLTAPCTASDSVETWFDNIYIEAVSGGSYTNHFNIQAPVRANRGFTIGMLHANTVSTAGNYQHINALSRDGMANNQFGFGYSTPAIPGTSSFTNANYYSVTIYQTGTPGGTLTITDLKSNAIAVGTPSVFTLQPGESGQFATSGPSSWRWYANIN